MSSPEGQRRSCLVGLFLILVIFLLVGGYFVYRRYGAGNQRSARVLAWLRDASAHSAWSMRSGQLCNNAPFLFPTNGFVGYLWDDSFRIGHRHQGIDIFGGTDSNIIPVLAAYPGYLTRLPDWKSTIIIRIPDDPLHPGRQIWTYYTHMASPAGDSFISPAFPPGTIETFVEAGTLLGYQGSYSGTPGNPVGVHLHFSIVKDDGQGKFLNELDINHTLDPSPYLGLSLNANENQDEIPICTQ